MDLGQPFLVDARPGLGLLAGMPLRGALVNELFLLMLGDSGRTPQKGLLSRWLISWLYLEMQDAEMHVSGAAFGSVALLFWVSNIYRGALRPDGRNAWRCHIIS